MNQAEDISDEIAQISAPLSAMIGTLVGKDFKASFDAEYSAESNTRKLIVGAGLGFIVITIAFLLVYSFFSNDAERLDAVGQLLGAYFSCLALLGLVAGQQFQYRSIALQKASLDAQMDALLVQSEAIKAANIALATEMMHNSMNRVEAIFGRYARSLLWVIAEVHKSDVDSLDKAARREGYEVYCRYVTENQKIADFVSAGISQNKAICVDIAETYVRRFNLLRAQSQKLATSSYTSDIFQLHFDDSPAHHLFVILRDALGRRAKD